MMSRTSRPIKWAYILAYLFFMLAGIAAMYAPSQILLNALLRAFVYAWALFLIAGGLACLFGKLRDKWDGEVIGLPLLSTSHFIFGFLLIFKGATSASLAIGGIFCGIGIAWIGRWLELRKLSRLNQEVNS